MDPNKSQFDGGVLNMLEIPQRVNYGEWDHADFIIPKEFELTSESFLHEAIQVFYQAGGFDFFKVINPEKYAAKWLAFVGGLYADIEGGKYKSDGKSHKNPLSDADRLSLRAQGVPELFLCDIDG
ncbi:MAG: hypothetical protein IKS29_01880 [Oscillospiraceae bacterium]|nr:hypothetical protein [Oscillospiraceae bacterium]